MAEILHIVPFEVRAGTGPDQIEPALAAARRLAEQIDGVLEVAAGPDVSSEGMAGGYTHALVFRFADHATRDRFLDHPAHVAAGDLLRPLLERALVIEIEVSGT